MPSETAALSLNSRVSSHPCFLYISFLLCTTSKKYFNAKYLLVFLPHLPTIFPAPISTRPCGRLWKMRTLWLYRACCQEITAVVLLEEEEPCGREEKRKRRPGEERRRRGWTGWATRASYPWMWLPLPITSLCSMCWQGQERNITLFVSKTKKTLHK